MGSSRAQEPSDQEPYYRWDFPDGTPWARFYRSTSGFVLRFPGLADFEVSVDGRHVSCAPAPGTSRAAAEHLYLNQVLPLALSKLGKLVFHASSVEVEGSVVAFVAQAGRGKSTLAASFAVNGYRFLGDDGLHLEPSDQDYLVMPSHPSIRLWEDSQDQLVSADAQKAPALEFTSKSRFLAGDMLPHCNSPTPLRAAFFLGEGETERTILRPLGAIEAVLEWTKHSFLLEVEDRVTNHAHFERIAALAGAVPCYFLDYPRRYSGLASLRQIIIDVLSSKSTV